MKITPNLKKEVKDLLDYTIDQLGAGDIFDFLSPYLDEEDRWPLYYRELAENAFENLDQADSLDLNRSEKAAVKKATKARLLKKAKAMRKQMLAKIEADWKATFRALK